MKIIILGGYGVFGGRLCELLAPNDQIEIYVAGRSLNKAQMFCSTQSGSARFIPWRIDRDNNLTDQIQHVSADLLIDASGPFQIYGDDPYRVVKACITAKINYMDFADGAEFVDGITQFDSQAKQSNLFLLSGVSSFPVLTAAVVRHLSSDWERVKSIQGGIAPSPYAIVGANVIKAISAYAGQSIQTIEDGKKITAYGFTESRHYTISPPGKLPLQSTRFSLVDVPDLKVLPKIWTELDSIWMGAGPTPEILLRLLNAFSYLVKFRILPSLIFFAPLFHFVITHARWGEHRGGMFVEISGESKDGLPSTRSWHLLAEENDGPYIPCMALEAIVLRLLRQHPPSNGARPATTELELSDYETLFLKRNIYTGLRESEKAKPGLSIFKKVLGSAASDLPVAIEKLHAATSGSKFVGTASVIRGKNILSRLIANSFGFPKAGKGIPIEFTIEKKDGKEYWTRQFGEKKFTSIIACGSGRLEHLICEQFGPFKFGIALVLDNGQLHYIVRNWYFLTLRLPQILCPRGESYEYVDEDTFHFNVEIKVAVIGLIVRYKGYLIDTSSRIINSDRSKTSPVATLNKIHHSSGRHFVFPIIQRIVSMCHVTQTTTKRTNFF
ncbi:DUF4166 domain-containing protein [Undibacterium jejuense]|uniref:DUF4166 domain-containing protein n=1 Tax=Undibacterium jejuense TaxID=1344949 RepID=A0A923HNN3_9BURK|nr:SDR family oxidoreductase [Undibacterium jejuense]MBC3861953.1 DUF4166 domain-containing protein [Undibacterium jejuense]